MSLKPLHSGHRPTRLGPWLATLVVVLALTRGCGPTSTRDRGDPETGGVGDHAVRVEAYAVGGSTGEARECWARYAGAPTPPAR